MRLEMSRKAKNSVAQSNVVSGQVTMSVMAQGYRRNAARKGQFVLRLPQGKGATGIPSSISDFASSGLALPRMDRSGASPS